MNEGWGFAAIVGLAAQAPAAKTSWTAPAGTIIVLPATPSVGPRRAHRDVAAAVGLTNARVTWEAAGQEPWVGGTSFTFTPAQTARSGSIAEAMLPDGRRVVSTATVMVQ